MGFSDIGLRHIVDVDGQLLGIDAPLVEAANLLARANCPEDSQLWMVQAGERFPLEPTQIIHLSEDEVLFFESSVMIRREALYRLAA